MGTFGMAVTCSWTIQLGWVGLGVRVKRKWAWLLKLNDKITWMWVTAKGYLTNTAQKYDQA